VVHQEEMRQSKGGGNSPQSNLLLPNTTEARKAAGKATLSRRKQMRLESQDKSEPNRNDFTVSLQCEPISQTHIQSRQSLFSAPPQTGPLLSFPVRSASQSLRVSMTESSNEVQPPCARFGVMGCAASPAKVTLFAAC
jgi:hypothetical protein